MTTATRPDGRFGFALVTAASAAVLFLAALRFGADSAVHSDLYATAWRLDAGAPVSDTSIDRLAPMIDALVERDDCRDDTVRAAVTVALAAVDRRDQIADFEGWAVAVERATAIVRHAAGCNPADGLRWALLAALEWSAAEVPDRLASLLAMSARRSPAELGALRARSELWARVSPATRGAARDIFEADIRTFVAGAEPQVVAAAFARSDSDLRDQVGRAAEQLSEIRRKALVDAGLDWIRVGAQAPSH